MATDNMPLTGNNLPGLVFRHGRTYGLNHAAELMAHMHPYRNGLLGPFIPIPNMKIRAANGCFMNFDQDVIRADFRHRNIHQFQTGACLRFYKSFHAPHSCSFSPASASSKFISERRKNLENGGFRHPFPSHGNARSSGGRQTPERHSCSIDNSDTHAICPFQQEGIMIPRRASSPFEHFTLFTEPWRNHFYPPFSSTRMK